MTTDKINEILGIKAAFKSALIENGADGVTDVFAEYPEMIRSLKGAGGGNTVYDTFFEKVPGEFVVKNEQVDGQWYSVKFAKYRYVYADGIYVAGEEVSREVTEMTNRDYATFRDIAESSLTGVDSIVISELEWSMFVANAELFGIVNNRGYDIFGPDGNMLYKRNTILAAMSPHTGEPKAYSFALRHGSGTWDEIGYGDEYGICLKKDVRRSEPFDVGLVGASKPEAIAIYVNLDGSECRGVWCDMCSQTTEYYVDGQKPLETIYALGNYVLETFRFPKKVAASAWTDNSFLSCRTLTNLEFPEGAVVEPAEIWLNYSPISRESFLALANALETNVGSTLAVHLSTDTTAVLTDDDKKSLTEKGYTIA